MMSISGFAYQIGALSNPPDMMVNAVRRAMRTASVPLVIASVYLPPLLRPQSRACCRASSAGREVAWASFDDFVSYCKYARRNSQP
jgi:hypothetical protein